MMGTMRSMADGLQAALLLARGRDAGLALLDAAADSRLLQARRSFWALALCLPTYLCIVLLGRLQVAPGTTAMHLQLPAHPAHELASDIFVFLVGWLGFAVASHWAAQLSGRAALWPRFIAAYNWCSVVQYGLMVAASLPPVLGAPDWLSETVWLVAFGWVVWIEWFTARLALALPAGAAAAIVLLDLAIGLGLTAVAALF